MMRLFSTLCRACHARIHHLYGLRYGMSPFLQKLWQEQHRGQAEQLELPFAQTEMLPTAQSPLFGHGPSETLF
jgi:hypothetical protein